MDYPITITIQATSPFDLRQKMKGLLDGDRATQPVNNAEQSDVQDAEPEKPKRAPRSTKPSPEKEEPAKQATDEAGDNADASGEKSSASTSTTATTDVSPSDEPLDATEVKKRGFRYAQKAGPVAATELITQAGAPNGKFEELDEDGLARLVTALDELGY